jgi:hypothetical protein
MQLILGRIIFGYLHVSNVVALQTTHQNKPDENFPGYFLYYFNASAGM